MSISRLEILVHLLKEFQLVWLHTYILSLLENEIMYVSKVWIFNKVHCPCMHIIIQPESGVLLDAFIRAYNMLDYDKGFMQLGLICLVATQKNSLTGQIEDTVCNRRRSSMTTLVSNKVHLRHQRDYQVGFNYSAIITGHFISNH